MQALLEHLFTSGPAPWEYIELILCRDVYHCVPSALPDMETIAQTLMMIQLEHRVQQMRK